MRVGPGVHDRPLGQRAAEWPHRSIPHLSSLRWRNRAGRQVLFGGINAGKITAVRPWSSDPTKIEILLDVKENTPLNEKSVAKLGLVSVMSGAALSISTGSNDAKRLPPG